MKEFTISDVADVQIINSVTGISNSKVKLLQRI